MLMFYESSGRLGGIKIWVDDLLLVAYPAFFGLVNCRVFHLANYTKGKL